MLERMGRVTPEQTLRAQTMPVAGTPPACGKPDLRVPKVKVALRRPFTAL
jgi:hypothetical protein